MEKLEKEQLASLVNISEYARKYAELESKFLEEEGMSWLMSGLRLVAKSGQFSIVIPSTSWSANYRGFNSGTHVHIPSNVIIKCLDLLKQQGFSISELNEGLVTISWNN